MTAKHTPAPWHPKESRSRIGVVSDEGRVATMVISLQSSDERIARARVDARLIAAAPDHAMIAAVLCTGVARWERGEFCVEGFRHSTRLDEFGVPILTHALRAAIDRALATEEAKR